MSKKTKAQELQEQLTWSAPAEKPLLQLPLAKSHYPKVCISMELILTPQDWT